MNSTRGKAPAHRFSWDRRTVCRANTVQSWLMCAFGICGVVRGWRVKTTTPVAKLACPADQDLWEFPSHLPGRDVPFDSRRNRLATAKKSHSDFFAEFLSRGRVVAEDQHQARRCRRDRRHPVQGLKAVEQG